MVYKLKHKLTTEAPQTDGFRESSKTMPPSVSFCYCEVGVRQGLAKAHWAKQPEEETDLFQTSFIPSLQKKIIPAQHEQGQDPDVAAFIFPHGVRLVTPDVADANPIPVVTSFVLTSADRSRMYGACIVWYEPLPVDVLNAYLDECDEVAGKLGTASVNNESPKDSTRQACNMPDDSKNSSIAHAPEAICLLSRAPVFEALNSCCRQLFRVRLSGALITENFLDPLFSTPIPPHGCSASLQLGNAPLTFSIPGANELPHTMMRGRDYLLLFERLDVASVIMIWAMLLTEHKVVLQASQCHLLTMAAETLCSLLFPFNWQFVYIPILPASYLDILQAPVPFLMGIDEEVLSLAMERGDIPDDVVQVDLDQGTISCDPVAADAMRLPQKAYHKLYKALAPYCRPPNADASNVTNAMSAFPMAPPPDVEADSGRSSSFDELTDEEITAVVAKIKAAFLRFFVSLMVKYQELMILPSAAVKQPAALDFFDLRRWLSRYGHNGGCDEWLETFARSQAFNQWLEQRLFPSRRPDLEVVFFNEQIDAKVMRSTKGKLFNKAATPLLSTGQMAEGGYVGDLVPEKVRTVYNASLISARPLQSQQQVALLLFLDVDAFKPTQKDDAPITQQYTDRLKQEFARLLIWSRIDIAAALRIHVCEWTSAAKNLQIPFSEYALDSAPVRSGALNLALYATSDDYRSQLHLAVTNALSKLAADGGENLPLCVVASGFCCVVVRDVLAAIQQATVVDTEIERKGRLNDINDVTDNARYRDSSSVDFSAIDLSPLERGETLAYLATLGCPAPLLPTYESSIKKAESCIQVPASAILRRCQRLRGGWTNLYHRADPLACPLQRKGAEAQAGLADIVASGRPTRGVPIQNCYLNDSVFVTPVAQALSWVWQDVNRIRPHSTTDADYSFRESSSQI